MANLPVVQSSVVGADVVSTVASLGGDTFINDGKTVLVCHNTGASCSITITPQKKLNGLTILPVVRAVASGTDTVIGPFDPSIFNTGADVVGLTYSGGYATTTIAPVSL